MYKYFSGVENDRRVLHRIKTTQNLEWRIVVHPIAELLSYADDLAKKRRNCGSCFLVPDTPCIWCANRWKCSLFEQKMNLVLVVLYLNLLMYRSSKTAYRLHPLLKENEDEYLAAME
ncbi:hypothetical protein Tsp_03021 [Trichinella spiralis]|uniref:hypothetical protein n=1 Tax=Trichinella spiralis TaxID=6334 RepID=UPI0001EFB3F7|nr:hypothetical protein Tsp_03021 [Trichinella spiralis]